MIALLCTLNVSLSIKTECDYLYGWTKNGQIRKNLTQNGDTQRYSWERWRRRRMYAITDE